MRNEVIQYARKDNQKVGAFYARTNGNNVIIGWSFCNTKAGDKFDRELGLELADQKAENVFYAKNFERLEDSVPFAYREAWVAFIKRCLRYYAQEDANFPQWVVNNVATFSD